MDIRLSAQEFEQNYEQSLRSKKVRIFLCGAGIDRSNRPSGDQKEANLRYDILEKLEGVGCEVILGEDGVFYKRTREVLKGNYNHAEHELFLAARHADLTIIFPCSAGSFAELGMFALVETISNKLIIIIDDQADFREGYIAKGPALMAETYGTIVEFMSYNDVEAIWLFLKSHVEITRVKKLRKEIITNG